MLAESVYFVRSELKSARWQSRLNCSCDMELIDGKPGDMKAVA
jgi:hypothetical protein